MADLYVDGKWRAAVAGGHREIRCPADGTLVARVSEATRPDTEAAIAAARRAFDEGPWPRTPERERGALLLRTADIIERDAKEFARAESLDTGKRLVESEYDIADVVSCLRHYGGIAGKFKLPLDATLGEYNLVVETMNEERRARQDEDRGGGDERGGRGRGRGRR